jgi:DNA repair exonuclease SbcCD ATPase subunit
MPTKFGIDKLKEAYNYFFESRKDAKRELATKEAKIVGYVEPESLRSLSVIEKELTEILGKEAAQKSVKTALDIYKTSLSNRENAEANLRKLKEQIDGIKASRPDANTLKEINASILKAQEDISNAKTMIAIMEESIMSFENALENLNKPICPLSNALVCTTDKTAAKEEFEDLLSSNREGITIQKDIIEKNNTLLKELETRKKEHEENSRAYERKILLTTEYEKQKKNLPTVPPKPEGAVVEDFTLEKEKLQKDLKVAKEYDQYKEDLAVVEIFRNKVAVFNSLCKIFEPKGDVMSNIAEHYMSVFETVANKRAKEINPEFEIKFSSADGIEYFLKTNSKGEFRPYDTLSSGEKALCAFVILDMLNTLSNLRILMIDDLDKLDKEAFESLIDLVQSKEVQDSYDHIIICAVDHEDVVKTLHKYSNIDFL